MSKAWRVLQDLLGRRALDTRGAAPHSVSIVKVHWAADERQLGVLVEKCYLLGKACGVADVVAVHAGAEFGVGEGEAVVECVVEASVAVVADEDEFGGVALYVAAGDCGGGVGGAVVAHYHFESGVGLSQERFEGLGEGVSAVVYAHEHGYARGQSGGGGHKCVGGWWWSIGVRRGCRSIGSSWRG